VTTEPASEAPLLPAGPADRHFDYCLQPYRPRTTTRGKARSENLLWHALEVSGLSAAKPALHALQDALGRDMTVWGWKFDGAQSWVELYFYDPQKEDVRASVPGLKEILAPHLALTPNVPDWVRYMMVSFDLKPVTFETGVVDEVNLYLTGTDEHAGRSYRVRAGEARLDNTYRFLPPKQEIDTVLSLLQSSMFIDYDASPTVLSKVLIPNLFACKRICIAKKQQSDGVYYSGIDIDQLLWFLKAFEYPAPIQSFVRRHKVRFEHLFFDVGIDTRQHPDKRIHYPKSSFYGTL
jgi:hypothetical protein